METNDVLECLPATIIAYHIERVPLVTGLTRTQLFNSIKRKELTARKYGRRTIIESDELRRWIGTFPIRGRIPENSHV